MEDLSTGRPSAERPPISAEIIISHFSPLLPEYGTGAPLPTSLDFELAIKKPPNETQNGVGVIFFVDAVSTRQLSAFDTSPGSLCSNL